MKDTVEITRHIALEKFLGAAEAWEDFPSDSEHAPDAARRLLAASAGICRMYPLNERPDAAMCVERLLEREGEQVLKAWLLSPNLERWIEQARDLDQILDGVQSRDVHQEFDHAAIDAWDELDQHGLAHYQARAVALSRGASLDRLNVLAGVLRRAEDFFADHLEVFLPAAASAAAVLASCRRDLLPSDPDLWRTTLIHRALAELHSSLDSEPEYEPLSNRDRQAIVDRAQQHRPSTNTTTPAKSDSPGRVRPSWSWLSETPMLMAADAAGPVPELIRVEWISPDEKGRAVTIVGPKSTDSVRINFRAPPAVLAELLAGKNAVLAGVESVIDNHGNAEFSSDSLRDAMARGVPDELRVTQSGDAWRRLS